MSKILNININKEYRERDARSRSFMYLQYYAKNNDFADKLNKIINKYAEYSSGGIDDILNNIYDKLSYEIHNGIGHKPICKEIIYKFILNNNDEVSFNLNCNIRIGVLLSQLDYIIDNHECSKNIESQFITTFGQIKDELMFDGWNLKEAGPQAAFLAMKRIADCWSVSSNETI